MANSDNKINIGGVWKDLDSVKINIGDSYETCNHDFHVLNSHILISHIFSRQEAR